MATLAWRMAPRPNQMNKCRQLRWKHTCSCGCYQTIFVTPEPSNQDGRKFWGPCCIVMSMATLLLVWWVIVGYCWRLCIQYCWLLVAIRHHRLHCTSHQALVSKIWIPTGWLGTTIHQPVQKDTS